MADHGHTHGEEAGHGHSHEEEPGRNMAFFDRRVDAILSLITGQGTDKYDPDLQRRAIEHYNEVENPSRSASESWILAIKALAVELGTLDEGEIKEKLKAMRRAFEDSG